MLLAALIPQPCYLSSTAFCNHFQVLHKQMCCSDVAGVRGFGQGLLARTLTIAPGAAIQWLIYEHVKLQLMSVQS